MSAADPVGEARRQYAKGQPPSRVCVAAMLAHIDAQAAEVARLREQLATQVAALHVAAAAQDAAVARADNAEARAEADNTYLMSKVAAIVVEVDRLRGELGMTAAERDYAQAEAASAQKATIDWRARALVAEAEVDRLRKRRPVVCPLCDGKKALVVVDRGVPVPGVPLYPCPRCHDPATGKSTGAVMEDPK